MIEKDDETFKIKDWGIISLVENKYTCNYTLRTGNKCCDNVKHCIYHTDKIKLFNTDDGNTYSCERHKDKLIPKIERIIKSKKNICQFCDTNASYGIQNTGFFWCDTHYEKKGKSFEKKIKTKKASNVNCAKQQTQDLAVTLFDKLDNEHSNFLDVEYVLIENQPSFKNPKMKTIASMLYSYFVLRGKIDDDIIKEVKFICPSNKLKVNKSVTNKVLNENKDKIYKMTKKLGIKYCQALICKKDNEILSKFKKKDDMCDAFLQGFQFLFSPVPEIYFKKLSTVGFDDK